MSVSERSAVAYDMIGLLGTVSVGVLVDRTAMVSGTNPRSIFIRPALITVPLGAVAGLLLYVWATAAGLGVAAPLSTSGSTSDASLLVDLAPLLLGLCGVAVACVDSAVPTASRRALVDAFVSRVAHLPPSQRAAHLGGAAAQVPVAQLTEDSIRTALGPAASSIANGVASIVVIISSLVAQSIARLWGWSGVFQSVSVLLVCAAFLELPEFVAAYRK